MNRNLINLVSALVLSTSGIMTGCLGDSSSETPNTPEKKQNPAKTPDKKSEELKAPKPIPKPIKDKITKSIQTGDEPSNRGCAPLAPITSGATEVSLQEWIDGKQGEFRLVEGQAWVRTQFEKEDRKIEARSSLRPAGQAKDQMDLQLSLDCQYLGEVPESTLKIEVAAPTTVFRSNGESPHFIDSSVEIFGEKAENRPVSTPKISLKMADPMVSGGLEGWIAQFGQFGYDVSIFNTGEGKFEIQLVSTVEQKSDSGVNTQREFRFVYQFDENSVTPVPAISQPAATAKKAAPVQTDKTNQNPGKTSKKTTPAKVAVPAQAQSSTSQVTAPKVTHLFSQDSKAPAAQVQVKVASPVMAKAAPKAVVAQPMTAEEVFKEAYGFSSRPWRWYWKSGMNLSQSEALSLAESISKSKNPEAVFNLFRSSYVFAHGYFGMNLTEAEALNVAQSITISKDGEASLKLLKEVHAYAASQVLGVSRAVGIRRFYGLNLPANEASQFAKNMILTPNPQESFKTFKETYSYVSSGIFRRGLSVPKAKALAEKISLTEQPEVTLQIFKNVYHFEDGYFRNGWKIEEAAELAEMISLSPTPVTAFAVFKEAYSWTTGFWGLNLDRSQAAELAVKISVRPNAEKVFPYFKEQYSEARSFTGLNMSKETALTHAARRAGFSFKLKDVATTVTATAVPATTTTATLDPQSN